MDDPQDALGDRRDDVDEIDVLLVDDDDAWVDSTGTVLEYQREGFSVTTATTLTAAADRFASTDPDCVVCDYQLEHGTGLELLAEVREIDPKRPFLLVTGAGSEGIASDAIGRQVTDYLPKRSLAGRDDVLARRIEATVRSYRTERALARERRSKETMLEIVTATTSRDGLTRKFCQHLVDERDYACAWIATRDGTNELLVQSIAGDDDVLEAVLGAEGSAREPDPAQAVLERREPVVLPPTCSTARGESADDHHARDGTDIDTATRRSEWHEIDHAHDVSGVAVPIEHDGTVVGALTVYAADGGEVDDREVSVLQAYGRTIGYALRTAEWKRSLVSTTPVAVEYEFGDERTTLSAFATCLPDGTSIEILTAIPLEDDLCYIIRVDSGSASAIRAAAEMVEGVTSVAVEDTKRRCELFVSRPTPEGVLATHGARVLETVVRRGRVTVTVVCPTDAAIQELTAALQERYPVATVGSIRSRPHPEREQTLDELLDSMTEKQLQAIELAFYAGYFERPREHNTTEIASKLGVSRATFTQHLRAAERKLLTQMFDSAS
ncbi:helix-turn-helix domain-containing protein [Salinadaptatus halalkaliphilus]|uniref:helix-turn-helix domain-containing protein n=1 Tax=Salinadaptatus halalkaliphilus TaxID=2419781 RepID=UPI001580F396|nr:helix-turn-helix domain-containing protein [Salinadaptatus halalkaliphilus]